MKGSCKYIELSGHGQQTRSDPPAWELGKVLTTPHRKNWKSRNIHMPRNSTNTLVDRDRWWALVNAVMNLQVP